MEPPKGPWTGCAFYPLPSVRIHQCMCVSYQYFYCLSQGNLAKHLLSRSGLHLPSVIGGKAGFPHTKFYLFLYFLEASLCAARQCREIIAFLQHLPLALILCSGTSYLLCMFACMSAFDGLLGLILAMQSLSPFSLVLVYVKPEEGRHQRWRMAIEKRSKCCRIIGGMRDFDCTVCCFMFCAV